MIQIEATSFAEALTRATKAMSQRTSQLPVLAFAHLQLVDSRLSVTCSDLAVTITAECPASAGDLDVLVPAALLKEYVARLDGALGIGVKDDELVIEGPRSHGRFRLGPRRDWPQFPSIQAKPVPAPWFPLIQRVTHAAAKPTGTKPLAEAVNFNGGRAAATDNKRVAFVEFDADLPPTNVSAAALRSLAGEEDFCVTFEAGRLTVEAENITATIRATEGAYPKYLNMVRSPDSTLTVDRRALAEAIATVSPMEADENRRIMCEPTADELVVRAIDPEYGEIEERVTCVATVEFPFDVNRGLTADMLKACDADEVTLQFGESNLRPITCVDGPLTQLMMPLHR